MTGLEEIDAMEKRATKGPWNPGVCKNLFSKTNEQCGCGPTVDVEQAQVDGEFIAIMRNKSRAFVDLAFAVKDYLDAPFCPPEGDDSVLTNAEKRMWNALARIEK